MATALMTGAQAAFGRNAVGTAAYPQTFQDQFNPLKFTGSLGPYTERPGVGISPNAPAGCEVEQVVLFARNGESYPTSSSIDAQKKVLKTIFKAAPKSGFAGSLAFLNKYQYFLEDDSFADHEIPSGPYSGLAGSYKFGAEFAGKYGDLWNEETLPIFSDKSERGLDSARAFGQGFLGYNYSKSAAVNTYDAFDSCKAKKQTECHVKTNSTNGEFVNNFRYPAFEIAALRLNQENGLSLTADDVFTLLELASSEIAAKGSSKWVEVFTTDEWIAFEYSYDAFFDCYYGSQSPRAKAIGSQFVNASAELLKKGPEEAMPLALVFGSDADLVSILANLKLAMPTDDLDPEEIEFDNNFKISDVAPMGARLVIERLKCKASGLSNDSDFISRTNDTKPLWNTNGTQPSTNVTASYPNTTHHGDHKGSQNNTTTSGSGNSSSDATFIRFILNDAVVPWKECYDGPGFTCSLENFLDNAQDKIDDADYEKVCGSKPQPLTFFSHYDDSTSLNYNNGTATF